MKLASLVDKIVSIYLKFNNNWIIYKGLFGDLININIKRGKLEWLYLYQMNLNWD